LTYGRLLGFFSGLGAATADVIYGLFAAAGLTFFTRFLIEQQTWLQYLGGLFLLYLGIKAFSKKTDHTPSTIKDTSGKKIVTSYLSVFFLTVTNPMTIFAFLAIFSSLGLSVEKENNTFLLVIGIFIGSALWWFILSFMVSLFRKKVLSHLNLINKLSGIILLLFGLLALIKG
jgi:threonine/homoserine/homoserine lactone efflux protein